MDKARPLASLLCTARAIARRPLPIKCVEAVFLALLLTAGMEDIDRVPVSFKVKMYFKKYIENIFSHAFVLILVARAPSSGAPAPTACRAWAAGGWGTC